MNKTNITQQIKSKQRVKDHGEVFTNPREVNVMLDLVMDESYRVDSRFLEPACGTGNFLVAILDRKLETVVKEHNIDQIDFEKHIFIAVSSIYAIDIQADNCEESRERMYKIVEKVYGEAYPDSQDNKFLKAIKYVLSKNVIHGDGLTGLRENAEGAPIIFSEWEMNSSNVVRKDFTMNDMVAHGKRAAINEEKSKAGGNSLFGLANMVQVEEKLNPINKYKPTYFKEVFKLE